MPEAVFVTPPLAGARLIQPTLSPQMVPVKAVFVTATAVPFVVTHTMLLPVVQGASEQAKEVFVVGVSIMTPEVAFTLGVKITKANKGSKKNVSRKNLLNIFTIIFYYKKT